jgi:hypothetical protein
MTIIPNRYKFVGYAVNITCSGTMNSRSLSDTWFWLVLLALIFVLAGSLEF